MSLKPERFRLIANIVRKREGPTVKTADIRVRKAHRKNIQTPNSKRLEKFLSISPGIPYPLAGQYEPHDQTVAEHKTADIV